MFWLECDWRLLVVHIKLYKISVYLWFLEIKRTVAMVNGTRTHGVYMEDFSSSMLNDFVAA